MRNYLKRFYSYLGLFGYDPFKTIYFFKGFPLYLSELNKIKKQKNNNTDFVFGNSFPILNEKNTESGVMSGHYFHQDLLVAKRIFQYQPEKHIDIGSRIDGFVSHVAVFREIEVFDIRMQTGKIKNIVFKQADLMNLPDKMINYCDSISSLHAIEHFGLGRYGDPIDYYGHVKAIENIFKILKKDGKLYLSVPIGEQRIEFNAHRVFCLRYLIKLLDPKFIIENFSYVDDKGDLIENVDLTTDEIKSNFNCHYGCGIFELTKK